MKETIGRLNNLFNNTVLQNKMLKNRAGEYEKVFRDIDQDINLLEDDNFELTGVVKNEVLSILDVMKNCVLFERNDQEELSFMKDFTLVIFNWNNNVGEDQKINIETKLITNVIEGQLTMRETIEIMKAINERMITLQNWNPPAFKISQSLFNALK